ncbi:MAG TPA: hypothetical protein VIN07_12120 [Flavipsychrobacter sp.]
MKKILSIISCCAVTVATMQSCGKDEASPAPGQPAACRPTYASGIQAIVNTRCAIAGCHDGNSGVVGFTSYVPLKERADNGRIRSFVFELKIMPPSSATQLTEDEKKSLQCWLDNGAPEN